jgi:hypothetical protein
MKQLPPGVLQFSKHSKEIYFSDIEISNSISDIGESDSYSQKNNPC